LIPTPAIRNKLTSFQNTINDMKRTTVKEMDLYTIEILSLKNAMLSIVNELANKEQTILNINNSITALKNEKENLRHQLTEKKNDMIASKHREKELELTSNDINIKLTELKLKYETLSNEKNKMSEQYATTVNTMKSNHTDQLNQIETKLTNEREELTKHLNASIQSWRLKEEKCRQNIDSLDSANATLNDQLNERTETLKMIEKKFTNASNAITHLKAELSNKENELANESKQNTTLRNDMKTLKIQMEKKINQNTTQHQSMMEGHAEVISKMENMIVLEQEQSRKLQNEMSKKNTLYEKALLEKEDLLQSNKIKIKQYDERLLKQKNEYEGIIRDMKRKMETVEHEKKETLAHLNEKEQLIQSNTLLYTSEREKCVNQIQQLTKERDDVSAQLKEKNEEYVVMEKQKKKMLSEHDAHKNERLEMEKVYKTQLHEKDVLLKESHQTNETLINDNTKHKLELSTLNERLMEVENTNKKMEENLLKHKNVNKSLSIKSSEEIQILKNELTHKNNEIISLKENHSTLTNQLRKDIHEYHTIKKTLEENIQKKQTSFNALEKEKDELNSKMKRIKEKFVEQEKRNNELKERNQQYEQDRKLSNEKYTLLENRVHTISNDLLVARDKLARSETTKDQHASNLNNISDAHQITLKNLKDSNANIVILQNEKLNLLHEREINEKDKLHLKNEIQRLMIIIDGDSTGDARGGGSGDGGLRLLASRVEPLELQVKRMEKERTEHLNQINTDSLTIQELKENINAVKSELSTKEKALSKASMNQMKYETMSKERLVAINKNEKVMNTMAKNHEETIQKHKKEQKDANEQHHRLMIQIKEIENTHRNAIQLKEHEHQDSMEKLKNKHLDELKQHSTSYATALQTKEREFKEMTTKYITSTTNCASMEQKLKTMEKHYRNEQEAVEKHLTTLSTLERKYNKLNEDHLLKENKLNELREVIDGKSNGNGSSGGGLREKVRYVLKYFRRFLIFCRKCMIPSKSIFCFSLLSSPPSHRGYNRQTNWYHCKRN
jgi:chromosome segregation ATPase